MQVTLDGLIAGPNGELVWAMAEDEESWQDHFRLMESVDTLLMGRVMYPARTQLAGRPGRPRRHLAL
jgi:dihydrofolate reductase